MGDFLLDFRPAPDRDRGLTAAEVALKFCGATETRIVRTPDFSLLLTRVDGFGLWEPASVIADGVELVAALAGRIALEEEQWQAARRLPLSGGAACRYLLDGYLRNGPDHIRSLNGNFAAFIHDPRVGRLLVATDRCGMFLAYHRGPLAEARVFGSHPDVLARVVGESSQFDLTSLSEFLATGRLSFPNTYYERIKGITPGSVVSITTRPGEVVVEPARPYFRFDFSIDPKIGPPEIAHRLAGAFRASVRRRTAPSLGRISIGLSGGLDSRAILSSAIESAGGRERIVAFTLYDEENTELRTARAIAEACRVEFRPIRRQFEHYGAAAELGVRISGGVGNIASNHFLGIRDTLAGFGDGGLLTGCYCDYLLKGLSLNTVEERVSREERITDFNYQYYHRHYRERIRMRDAVTERLASLFPEGSRPQPSDDEWLQIERKRAFPLAYEGDLAQRVIPQRVIPWGIPIVDNDLIDVYLGIPSRFKLNASLFKEMVLQLCDKAVGRVPDSNTGAPLDASKSAYSFHRYFSALRNRIAERLFPRMSTHGSWPNWQFYIARSHTIPTLWRRPNPAASDVFSRLLPEDPLKRDPTTFQGGDVEFFLRLFTLKLWLDQQFGVDGKVS